MTEAREGALSGWQEREFREHMTQCEPCRTYAGQFELTIAVLRALPREPVPFSGKQVLEALETRRRTTQGKK